MMNKDKAPVGGGVKKILYALKTINRIGLLDSKKALTTNNACKACGLGMGGQEGGMTNELGEFPAVCNKSIQAQSTDIQAPIPDQIFDYQLTDFAQLTPHELEHLGRLAKPVYKAKDSDKFETVEWDWAIEKAAQRFKQTEPEKSFFYSSGRSSNEAGFLFQLFARLYGSNHINNCSYYCHQATSVGLASTIGSGTATVELADLELADLIFVIGANPASNHPRFIHKLKDCRDRGGQVVIINPAKEAGLVKFALPKSPRSLFKGGSEIASEYLQPKIGSDIFVFKGIAKALIEFDALDHGFINRYTEGFSEFLTDVEQLGWHEIENQTQLTRSNIESVAKIYQNAKNTVFSWGMGITHHRHGVENVEYISNLTLLRGMVGRPGAGLLPLRGHSNVQGIGTIGVKPVLDKDIYQMMQEHLGVEFPNDEASKGMDTLACLESADRGEIDAALIMGGNLYGATPNSNWAKQALDNIGFKLFLTTTLNAGHIQPVDSSEALILPVKARDEEDQATTQESMFNFVRLSDGGIKRFENIRSESSILVDLFSQILAGKPQVGSMDIQSFSSHDKVRDVIAGVVPGMDKLKDISVAKKEFHVANRLIHKPDFNTPSRKANFITHSHKVSTLSDKEKSDIESDQTDACFTLMSVRSEGQFNSIIYEENDSYRKVDQRWAVMMNKVDIALLKVKHGSRVDIRSEFGEMLNVAVYEYDLPTGDVMAYYPEANVLIGLDRDPRSQTPAFKSVKVSISASA